MRIFVSKDRLVSALLIIWVASFFVQKTNLAASDLGRHIKNGEVILATGEVFSTNLYAYPHADFYVPNHHWLFGVIAYLIHQASGFAGLTLLSAFLYTSAITIIFLYSKKHVGLWPAVTATVIALPLLAERSETRPEAFSLFFYAALLNLCLDLLQRKSLPPWWWIAALMVMMILWVNIHIFFIFSAIVMVAASVHATLNRQFNILKWLLASTGLLGVVSLINPLGLELVMYPFQIFGNYGYQVSENQSLWFFLQRFTQPIHWYMLTVMILCLVMSVPFLIAHGKKQLFLTLMVLFTLLATMKLTRMENMFALTAIPFMSSTMAYLWQTHNRTLRNILNKPVTLMLLSPVLFALTVILIGKGLLYPFTTSFGLGLLPGYDKSMQFLNSVPELGPLFNNFDSGSFLIYTLYPREQVYIDNRAEAFPAQFIQESYITPQMDEAAWLELEARYQFNSIVFYWHDQTNWGQQFLITRTQDQSWVPIYVDNYILVMVKNVPKNQALIDALRLPPSMFSVSQP